MMELSTVIGLMLVMAGAFFFLQVLRVRDMAYQEASRRCRKMRVMFLDEAVVFHKIVWRREQGKRYLFLHYQFEYSDQDNQRCMSQVILRGFFRPCVYEQISPAKVVHIFPNRPLS